MSVNFPNTPTDGAIFTEPRSGEQWIYRLTDDSWTSLGLPAAGGLTYVGGIDITQPPPTNIRSGWMYTVTTGGAPNAGFTGLPNPTNAQSQVIFDGTNWQITSYVSTIPPASTTVPGIIELATSAEVTAGTDNLRAVTPAELKVELDKKINVASPAAPTPPAGDNSTSIATTEWVTANTGNGQINVSAGTGLTASGSNATANQQGNTTRTLALADSGVAPGNYTAANVTVDRYGRVTAASSGASMPPGAIIYMAGNNAPAGYLKADGSSVSRTTYAALFAVIGTTYGAGSTAAEFNLPDLRGEFVRGFDDGRGVDNGRQFGSFQADEFKSHSHPYLANRGGSDYGGSNPANGSPSSGTTSPSGGTETRPRNVALLACIKT